MFKKKVNNWDKPFSERIARRVRQIPTRELDVWVDQAMFDLGRNLSNFTKSGDFNYVEEALIGAEAIHAVVNELYVRNKKPVDL